MLALKRFSEAALMEREATERENNLSPEARAMLQAGIESAKSEPLVDLGSFAHYADEIDE
jgi:hypothetical protein